MVTDWLTTTMTMSLDASAMPFVPAPLPPFIDEILYLTVNWKNYNDRDVELFRLHRSKTPSWIFEFFLDTRNQTIAGPRLAADTIAAEAITKLYWYRYSDACLKGGVGAQTRLARKVVPKRTTGLEYMHYNTVTIYNPTPPPTTSYKQMLCGK